MRTSVSLAVALGLVGTSVVPAQTHLRKQGPELKSSQDARGPAVLAPCQRNHPPHRLVAISMVAHGYAGRAK
jgi:hypothetical protein